MRGAPSPCVLRVNAGERRFDPSWTLEYTKIAEGREGAMFSYLGNDQALIAAFYEELTNPEEATDLWAYIGQKWKIWTVDMNTGKGAPLEGLDFHAGAFTPVRFDGRFFLMVPGGDEVNWATRIWEVVNGRAEPRTQLPGWSYQFVKVR